jgi:hypothetical protein
MAIAKGNRKYNGKKEIPKEKEEGEWYLNNLKGKVLQR